MKRTAIMVMVLVLSGPAWAYDRCDNGHRDHAVMILKSGKISPGVRLDDSTTLSRGRVIPTVPAHPGMVLDLRGELGWEEDSE